jgi:hypothetical protein
MIEDSILSRPISPRMYKTAGGVVAPNCLLDLISPDGQRLELLVLEDGSISTKRALIHASGIYEPVSLEPGVRGAIHFPAAVAPCEKAQVLVDELSRVLGRYLEPQEDDDLLCIAIWNLSTCIWDFLPAPITLLITGDANHAFALLSLLSACARRPLCLADMSQSTLRRLPEQIGPTILVNRPDLSPAVRGLLRCGNLPGFLVPGAGMSLRSIAGPRALFIGNDDPDEDWTENVLHISLSRRWNPRYWLSGRDLAKIREQVQPLALGYRLNYWSVNNRLMPDSIMYSEFSRALLACVADDPELEKRLTSALERREYSAARLNPLDPNRALVECLWAPVHEGKTIAMADVTARLNALLRSRGEIRVFNSMEIGWRLMTLGVPRRRAQKHNEVRSTKDLIKNLHQLARKFELRLPEHDSCGECVQQLPKKVPVAAKPSSQVSEKAADM